MLSGVAVWLGFFYFPWTDVLDQVIRVFRVDQQSCYIIISKDTTAKDVVLHVVKEFGLIAAPETYSLCEVSVSPEGVIKQRRLPDQLSKLADRIQLNSRWDLNLTCCLFKILFNFAGLTDQFSFKLIFYILLVSESAFCSLILSPSPQSGFKQVALCAILIACRSSFLLGHRLKSIS